MMNLLDPTELRARLECILPGVQRPGRYLGLERHLIRKRWQEAEVRLLLAFPDEYGIGMSHQGTRILYHIANATEGVLCERAFAPWPDMAAAMGAAGVPLYSLESFRPAAAFDAIGITLQTELNYVNVPYLLDLAGLPRWAAQRDERHPLIVGGGPCTANPEPVAEFFDVFAIGDGEVLLRRLLATLREARAAETCRADLLLALARQEGFYVPRLYRFAPAPHPARGGRWEATDPAAPLPVRRVFAERLDGADVPPVPIVPAVEVVQDRLGMEVVRGCTQGCRFCQAGYWYRPVREHDPQVVLERMLAHVAATGYEEVGLLSLSSADYSQIEPLAHHLAETLAPRRVGVSLPSLRAESFSVALADAVSRVRRAGFTFAPETGSDRLRRVINKTFTNNDMLAAAEVAFARGWQLIKVYAMVGLPTETDADLEELAELARGILAAGRRAGCRRPEVKVSVGPFVPKSVTPFQWEPFGPVGELERRIGLLRSLFRAIPGARLTWNDPAEAALEALLARGDRRLAAVIARAHDLGAVFDGWREFANLPAWWQACREQGVDLEAELGRRDLQATLPWDLIDPGVRKGYLKAELRRALAGHATPDCRWGDCLRCGIPGDGADTRLAPASLQLPGEAAPERARARNAAYRLRPAPRLLPPVAPLTQPPAEGKVRVRFVKGGDARWLSHRNLMDLFERALRAAGWPVRYTEGYNPHIRLSMGPALGVGQEAREDYFEVECCGEVTPEMVLAANAVLPPGVELQGVEPRPAGAPGLGKEIAALRYRLHPADGGIPWPAAPPLSGVLGWEREGDDLLVTLPARAGGEAGVGLREVLAALGVEAHGGAVRIAREVLLGGGAAATAGPSPSTVAPHLC